MMQDVRYDGIRVSYIMPGSVDTDFGAAPSGKPRESWKLTGEDIAKAVIDLYKFPTSALASRIELRPRNRRGENSGESSRGCPVGPEKSKSNHFVEEFAARLGDNHFINQQALLRDEGGAGFDGGAHVGHAAGQADNALPPSAMARRISINLTLAALTAASAPSISEATEKDSIIPSASRLRFWWPR